ncbi:hypothetical protein SVIOM342S_08807 [Streptomyces violaceorubidus]
MTVRSVGDTVTYTSSRRWPGPRGADSRITLRTGERIHEPTPLEHFLTARWGMHNRFSGGGTCPTTIPAGPHRARLLSCDEDLVAQRRNRPRQPTRSASLRHPKSAARRARSR